MKIAILGAGGFLGSRFVETALLNGAFEVVPVIRGPRAAARLARFGPIWKSVDTSSPEKLAGVLTGCDGFVNATIGEYGPMAKATDAAWQACALAGVRQYVHLGTAEVFGTVESPAINDDSEPVQGHWMAYARAKGSAEMAARAHFGDSRLITTVLRPGLIWGPKSPWVEGPATGMLAGTSFLANGGRGACNLIYIDNLVAQVLSVVRQAPKTSGCFNVSDDEVHDWRGYYEALARQVGIPFSAVHQVEAGSYRMGVGDVLQQVKSSAFGQWLKTRLGPAEKRRIQHVLGVFKKPVFGPVGASEPAVTRGEWHLQAVKRKLPNAKFRSAFGRHGEIDFAEAMARSGEWLRASGYAWESPN